MENIVGPVDSIGTINNSNLSYNIIRSLSDFSFPLGILMTIILTIALVILLTKILTNKDDLTNSNEKIKNNSKTLLMISILYSIFVNILNIITMIFAIKSIKLVKQYEVEKANKYNTIFTIVAMILGLIQLNTIIFKMLEFVMWLNIM